MIKKKFIHFSLYSVFSTKRLSANSENTKYTLGIDGPVTDGTPDIPYQSIVFVKDESIIWTHGKTYSTSVTAAELGLGEVDNTRDIDKPVSTATQAALDIRYIKPSTGIPMDDLSEEVKEALTKALSAIQAGDISDLENLPDSVYTKGEVDYLIENSLKGTVKSEDITELVELPLNVYTKGEVDYVMEQTLQRTVSKAEGYLKDIKDTIDSLPDGTAVSAQVAVNTAEIAEVKAELEELKELFEGSVEGYVRVSGISNPVMESAYYNRGVGTESVFDIFKPCLVMEGTGKLLKVLDPMDWYHDEHGNPAHLDGTEGEVMICNTRAFFHITGHVLVNGTQYDVFLRSLSPFSWQGHEAIKQEPHGMSPGFVVFHRDADGITRAHSVYNESYSGSYQAQHTITGAYRVDTGASGELIESYDPDGAFFGGPGGLHSTDAALATGEQYAMNLNTDRTKTVPFFNRTAWTEEVWYGNMYAEGGTYDAHNANLMGSGFTTNDPATSAAHWEESNASARNGFRYLKADGTWAYNAFNNNTSFGNGKTSDNLYRPCFLNLWRSPWKIFEQQRVLMYAHAENIPELTWFAFEGNKYKWKHVSGFAGPSEGIMTAVVWKHFASKLEDGCTDPVGGADISGNRAEFLISSAVYRGVITDVSPSWWMSGLIFTEDHDGLYKAYGHREQSELILSNETADKNVGETYRFQDAYEFLGEYTYGSGYRKNFNNQSLFLADVDANKTGGGLHTYVGAYGYFTGTKPAENKVSVRGARRGLSASGSGTSPFYVAAGSSPAYAVSGLGFGTCVRLT